ncbi:hypothetical protein N2605_04850 [Bradyrhizobium yuanmingense]|uniref:hypothetical protein n=1 Tax=Bradyrhizobium TaxID=374 RepID=UPI001CD4C97D|nr:MULTISPECIES: hypothetical protein [unclassified Bradyrhizobium]MCA1512312.1 hypothetical protein [Bradyrhizobium sp. NBAIM01]UWU85795.1 hypothetical protein N2605_04850 [Bradyrhizobium sp. CB1024]
MWDGQQGDQAWPNERPSGRSRLSDRIQLLSNASGLPVTTLGVRTGAGCSFSPTIRTATSTAWTAEGPDFTPQQVIAVPYNPIFDLTSFMLVAVVKLDSISGTRQIITRSDAIGSPQHFQFRQTAGVLQFVNGNGNQVLAASSATLTAGAWALVVAKMDGIAATAPSRGIGRDRNPDVVHQLVQPH